MQAAKSAKPRVWENKGPLNPLQSEPLQKSDIQALIEIPFSGI